MHDRYSLRDLLDFYNLDHRMILKCCLLIRADCEGGTSAGIKEINIQSQRAKDPNKLLDRALSILIHIPETHKERARIELYAFGKLRGRPPYAIKRFWDSVPPEAVADMVPITASLLG